MSTNKPTQSPAQRPHKHIPQRMCVVCRETNAKRTLTRIVRTPDAGVQVDPTGKRSGRGAYVCDKSTCWQRAAESDVLEKALRTTLTVDDRQRLREVMTAKMQRSETGQG
jgi:predicted RNA-binding protein YlxR (DUF448 family)